MTETVLEEMNLKIIINKNTITIKDENGKILYTHTGRFIYKKLDETNFAIIEKDKSKLNALIKGYTLIFFHYNKDKKCIEIEKFQIRKDYGNIFNKNLMSFKELIIPGIYHDFIYSFEFNLEVSDSFSKIIFDEHEETFIVCENIQTKHGIVPVFGELNIDGFLLHEAMYAPLLHQEFYVNPFEVPKRLISLKDEINLMMYYVKKKKRKKDINEYECDCYLTRKRDRN